MSFAAEALILPTIFLLKGRWSPAKARLDEQQHERMIEAELAAMHA